MNLTDRIQPTDKGITTYLDELQRLEYQIPTFQRNVVWEKENVKKLWDSIYKFYPLGSILVWKTDTKLQNHRSIGGHVISSETFNRSEYKYILDGQQRTTSLLTSLYGGSIEDRPNFNPSIYFDLTIENDTEIDDESYKKRFLYWDEIDDKQGKFKHNIGQNKKYKNGLIVKLLDIKNNFSDVERKIVDSKINGFSDYDHPIRKQLRHIKQVLDNYRLSFIELKGIQVSEVCQIFERINQAGRQLDIFDIVVAKTFRPVCGDKKGFYLRELIDDFRKTSNSKFMDISNLDYLQIIAVIIREYHDECIRNITPRYLNDIKAEHIHEVWPDTAKAINKTFDFFENTLGIKGPSFIPYRYFYLTLATYFFKNKNPDYDFLTKYFWHNSFHYDDLLSNTSDVKEHITFLKYEKENTSYTFERFTIDKDELRNSSYSSKGRLSRAILSLYATKRPKDWKFTERDVLTENLFFSVDKPNLHHVFPTNYVAKNPGSNQFSQNSLMNIVYLTQITNLEISDKNPLLYIREYDKNPQFAKLIKSHLLPQEILTWARQENMPDNALDQFIEKRVDIVISELKRILGDASFSIIDTNKPDQD